MISKNPFLRTIAALTVLCFVSTNLTASPLPAPGYKEAAFSSLVQKIEIPENLGRVQERFVPASPSVSTVIHIQDAHSSLEAQKHIYGILKYLQKNYETETLFLEGGTNELRPELLDFFQDAKLNAEALSFFEKKGLIGGTERFLYEARKKGKKFSGYGIEEPQLYGANLRAYRAVISKKQISENFLKNLQDQILTQSSHVFGKELKDFFREYSFHQEHSEALPAYLKTLQNWAREKAKVDLKQPDSQLDWPQLVRFSRLQDLEGQIDDVQAAKEAAAVKAWMKGKKIKDRAFEALIEKALANLKAESPRTVLEKFYDHASVAGFSYEKYPELSKSLGRLVLQSELQAGDLFDEIQKLSEEILNKLAASAEEKDLLGNYEIYLKLKKLFSLELLRADYLAVSENPSQYRPSGIFKRVAAQQSGISLDATDELFQKALSFYDGAVKRESAMIENWIHESKKNKKTVSILITGGFHAPGLSEKLKEQGIAYVQITPRISDLKDTNDYDKVMKLAGVSKSSVNHPTLSNPLPSIAAADSGMGTYYRREVVAALDPLFKDAASRPARLAQIQNSPAAKGHELNLRWSRNHLRVSKTSAQIKPAAAAPVQTQTVSEKPVSFLSNISSIFLRIISSAAAWIVSTVKALIQMLTRKKEKKKITESGAGASGAFGPGPGAGRLIPVMAGGGGRPEIRVIQPTDREDYAIGTLPAFSRRALLGLGIVAASGEVLGIPKMLLGQKDFQLFEQVELRAKELSRRAFVPQEVKAAPDLDYPRFNYVKENEVQPAKLSDKNGTGSVLYPRRGTLKQKFTVYHETPYGGFREVKFDAASVKYPAVDALGMPVSKKLPDYTQHWTQAGFFAPSAGGFPEYLNFFASGYHRAASLGSASIPETVYGTSGRSFVQLGNLEELKGEDEFFPELREIYIRQPEGNRQIIYQIYESPEAVMIQTFDVTVTAETTIKVSGEIIPRVDREIQADQNMGIAGFSSMYFRGPREGFNRGNAAYDVNHINVTLESGAKIDYELSHPPVAGQKPKVQNFGAVKAWSLESRYEDPSQFIPSVRYQDRASFYISGMKIESDGKPVPSELKAIFLDPDMEFKDNVVAAVVLKPQTPVFYGQTIRFSYQQVIKRAQPVPMLAMEPGAVQIIGEPGVVRMENVGEDKVQAVSTKNGFGYRYSKNAGNFGGAYATLRIAKAGSQTLSWDWAAVRKEGAKTGEPLPQVVQVKVEWQYNGEARNYVPAPIKVDTKKRAEITLPANVPAEFRLVLVNEASRNDLGFTYEANGVAAVNFKTSPRNEIRSKKRFEKRIFKETSKPQMPAPRVSRRGWLVLSGIGAAGIFAAAYLGGVFSPAEKTKEKENEKEEKPELSSEAQKSLLQFEKDFTKFLEDLKKQPEIKNNPVFLEGVQAFINEQKRYRIAGHENELRDMALAGVMWKVTGREAVDHHIMVNIEVFRRLLERGRENSIYRDLLIATILKEGTTAAQLVQRPEVAVRQHNMQEAFKRNHVDYSSIKDMTAVKKLAAHHIEMETLGLRHALEYFRQRKINSEMLRRYGQAERDSSLSAVFSRYFQSLQRKEAFSNEAEQELVLKIDFLQNEVYSENPALIETIMKIAVAEKLAVMDAEGNVRMSFEEQKKFFQFLNDSQYLPARNEIRTGTPSDEILKEGERLVSEHFIPDNPAITPQFEALRNAVEALRSKPNDSTAAEQTSMAINAYKKAHPPRAEIRAKAVRVEGSQPFSVGEKKQVAPGIELELLRVVERKDDFPYAEIIIHTDQPIRTENLDDEMDKEDELDELDEPVDDLETIPVRAGQKIAVENLSDFVIGPHELDIQNTIVTIERINKNGLSVTIQLPVERREIRTKQKRVSNTPVPSEPATRMERITDVVRPLLFNPVTFMALTGYGWYMFYQDQKLQIFGKALENDDEKTKIIIAFFNLMMTFGGVAVTILPVAILMWMRGNISFSSRSASPRSGQQPRLSPSDQSPASSRHDLSGGSDRSARHEIRSAEKPVQEEINRALQYKEAAIARSAYVQGLNRSLTAFFEEKDPAMSQEDVAKAVRVHLAFLEELNRRIGPDSDAADAEAEKKMYASIDGLDNGQLLQLQTDLLRKYEKEMLPQFEAANSKNDHVTLEKLNREAAALHKSRVKTQIRRILESAGKKKINQSAILSQLTALRKNYLRLALEYNFRYWRAVERAGIEKISLIGHEGRVEQTHEYGAFRILIPESEREEIKIIRNYWVNSGMPGTYEQKALELKISDLDTALRLQIHTLVSQQEDYSRILFHITALQYVLELLENEGSQLTQYYLKQIQANLEEVLNGKGGLAKGKVHQKTQGAASLALVFPLVEHGKIEQAMSFVRETVELLQSRQKDIESKHTGMQKQRDYIAHRIRQSETYRAAEELEKLIEAGNYQQASELIGLLYQSHYLPIDSTVVQYLTLKNFIAQSQKLITDLASMKAGERASNEAGLVRSLKSKLIAIKRLTRSELRLAEKVRSEVREKEFPGKNLALERYERSGFNHMQSGTIYEGAHIGESGDLFAAQILRWEQEEMKKQDELMRIHAMLPRDAKVIEHMATGNTPWIGYTKKAEVLKTWDTPETQAWLVKHGIDPKYKPDMKRVIVHPLDALFPQKRTDYHSFANILNHMFERLGIPQANRHLFYGDVRDKEGNPMTEKAYKALMADIQEHGLLIEEYLRLEMLPNLSLKPNIRAAEKKRLERLLQGRRIQREYFKVLTAYSRKMAQELVKKGGAHIFISGVGPNYDGKGHIGFMEEGTPFSQDLLMGLIGFHMAADHMKENGGMATMWAKNGTEKFAFVTYGFKELLKRPGVKVLGIATGIQKARAMRRGIEGQAHDDTYPISHLQDQNITWVLDRFSAVELRYKTNFWDFEDLLPQDWTEEKIAQLFITLSKQLNKPVAKITMKDLLISEGKNETEIRSVRKQNLRNLLSKVKGDSDGEKWKSLRQKVSDNVIANRMRVDGFSKRLRLNPHSKITFVNPHLDDDVLAMYPNIRQMVKEGHEVSVWYTAPGYTAVHTDYAMKALEQITSFGDKEIKDIATVAKTDSGFKALEKEYLNQLIKTLETERIPQDLKVSDYDIWSKENTAEQSLRAKLLLLRLIHQRPYLSDKLRTVRSLKGFIAILQAYNQSKPGWGSEDLKIMKDIKVILRFAEAQTSLMRAGVAYENINYPLNASWYGTTRSGMVKEKDVNDVVSVFLKDVPDLVITPKENFGDGGAHDNTKREVFKSAGDLKTLFEAVRNEGGPLTLRTLSQVYSRLVKEKKISIAFDQKQRQERKEFLASFLAFMAKHPVFNIKIAGYRGVWDRTPASGLSDQVSILYDKKELDDMDWTFEIHFRTQSLGRQPVPDSGFARAVSFSQQVLHNAAITLDENQLLGGNLPEDTAGVLNFEYILDLDEPRAQREAKAMLEELDAMRKPVERASATAVYGPVPYGKPNPKAVIKLARDYGFQLEDIFTSPELQHTGILPNGRAEIRTVTAEQSAAPFILPGDEMTTTTWEIGYEQLSEDFVLKLADNVNLSMPADVINRKVNQLASKYQPKVRIANYFYEIQGREIHIYDTRGNKISISEDKTLWTAVLEMAMSRVFALSKLDKKLRQAAWNRMRETPAKVTSVITPKSFRVMTDLLSALIMFRRDINELEMRLENEARNLTEKEQRLIQSEFAHYSAFAYAFLAKRERNDQTPVETLSLIDEILSDPLQLLPRAEIRRGNTVRDEEPLRAQLAESTNLLEWFNLLSDYSPKDKSKKVMVTIQIDRGVKMKVPMMKDLLTDRNLQDAAYRYIASWAYNLSIIYGTSLVSVGVPRQPDLINMNKIKYLLTNKRGGLSNIRESLTKRDKNPLGIRNYANAGRKIRFKRLTDLTSAEKKKKQLSLGIQLLPKVEGVYLGVDIGGGSAKFTVIENGQILPLPMNLSTILTVEEDANKKPVMESPEHYVARMTERVKAIETYLGKKLNGVGIDSPGAAEFETNRMVTLGQIPVKKKWNQSQVEWAGRQLTLRIAEELGLTPDKVKIRNDMDGVLPGIASLLPRVLPDFWKSSEGNFAFDWMGTGHGFQYAIGGVPMNAPTEAGHMIFDFGKSGDKIFDTESKTSIPSMLRYARQMAQGSKIKWDEIQGDALKPLADQAFYEGSDAVELKKKAIAEKVFNRFAEQYAANAAIRYYMSAASGYGNASKILFGGGIARGKTGDYLKGLAMKALGKYGLADKIEMTVMTDEQIRKAGVNPDDVGPIGSAYFIQSLLAAKTQPAEDSQGIWQDLAKGIGAVDPEAAQQTGLFSAEIEQRFLSWVEFGKPIQKLIQKLKEHGLPLAPLKLYISDNLPNRNDYGVKWHQNGTKEIQFVTTSEQFKSGQAEDVFISSLMAHLMPLEMTQHSDLHHVISSDFAFGTVLPSADGAGFNIVDTSTVASAFVQAYEFRIMVQVGAEETARKVFDNTRRRMGWPMGHLLAAELSNGDPRFTDEIHNYLGIMNHLILISAFKGTASYEPLLSELKEVFPAKQVDRALEYLETNNAFKEILTGGKYLWSSTIITHYLKPAYQFAGREILRAKLAEQLGAQVEDKIEWNGGTAGLSEQILERAVRGENTDLDFSNAEIVGLDEQGEQRDIIPIAEWQAKKAAQFSKIKVQNIALRAEIRSLNRRELLRALTAAAAIFSLAELNTAAGGQEEETSSLNELKESYPEINFKGFENVTVVDPELGAQVIEQVRQALLKRFSLNPSFREASGNADAAFELRVLDANKLRFEYIKSPGEPSVPVELSAETVRNNPDLWKNIMETLIAFDRLTVMDRELWYHLTAVNARRRMNELSTFIDKVRRGEVPEKGGKKPEAKAASEQMFKDYVARYFGLSGRGAYDPVLDNYMKILFKNGEVDPEELLEKSGSDPVFMGLIFTGVGGLAALGALGYYLIFRNKIRLILVSGKENESGDLVYRFLGRYVYSPRPVYVYDLARVIALRNGLGALPHRVQMKVDKTHYQGFYDPGEPESSDVVVPPGSLITVHLNRPRHEIRTQGDEKERKAEQLRQGGLGENRFKQLEQILAAGAGMAFISIDAPGALSQLPEGKAENLPAISHFNIFSREELEGLSKDLEALEKNPLLLRTWPADKKWRAYNLAVLLGRDSVFKSEIDVNEFSFDPRSKISSSRDINSLYSRGYFVPHGSTWTGGWPENLHEILAAYSINIQTSNARVLSLAGGHGRLLSQLSAYFDHSQLVLLDANAHNILTALNFMPNLDSQENHYEIKLADARAGFDGIPYGEDSFDFITMTGDSEFAMSYDDLTRFLGEAMRVLDRERGMFLIETAHIERYESVLQSLMKQHKIRMDFGIFPLEQNLYMLISGSRAVELARGWTPRFEIRTSETEAKGPFKVLIAENDMPKMREKAVQSSGRLVVLPESGIGKDAAKLQEVIRREQPHVVVVRSGVDLDNDETLQALAALPGNFSPVILRAGSEIKIKKPRALDLGLAAIRTNGSEESVAELFMSFYALFLNQIMPNTFRRESLDVLRDRLLTTSMTYAPQTFIEAIAKSQKDGRGDLTSEQISRLFPNYKIRGQASVQNIQDKMKIGFAGWGVIPNVAVSKMKILGESIGSQAKLMAWSPSLENGSKTAPEGVAAVSKDQMIHEANVISIHLPSEAGAFLTEADLRVLAARASPVNPIAIINTSRLASVDHDALLKIMEEYSAKSTGLHLYYFSDIDLTAKKQPIEVLDKLRTKFPDRVFMTNHIGAFTAPALKQVEENTVDQTMKLFQAYEAGNIDLHSFDYIVRPPARHEIRTRLTDVKNFLDSRPHAVWYARYDGDNESVEYVNPKFAEVYGTTVEDILTKRTYDKINAGIAAETIAQYKDQDKKAILALSGILMLRTEDPNLTVVKVQFEDGVLGFFMNSELSGPASLKSLEPQLLETLKVVRPDVFVRAIAEAYHPGRISAALGVLQRSGKEAAGLSLLKDLEKEYGFSREKEKSFMISILKQALMRAEIRTASAHSDRHPFMDSNAPFWKESDKPIFIVVGAGIAGIETSNALLEKGARVILMDRLPFSGGLGVVGIPHYEDRQYGLKDKMGRRAKVVLKNPNLLFFSSTAIGTKIPHYPLSSLQFSIDDLKRMNLPIVIATGAPVARTVIPEGEERPDNVLSATNDWFFTLNWNHFVRAPKNKKGLGYTYLPEMPEASLDGIVAIYGGGNVAGDAMKQLLKMGKSSRDIMLIYRGPQDLMSNLEHVLYGAALKKMGKVLQLREISGVRRNAEGKATHLILTKSKIQGFEIDTHGRPRPLMKGTDPTKVFHLPKDTTMVQVVQRLLEEDERDPSKKFFADRAAFVKQFEAVQGYFEGNAGYELKVVPGKETEEVPVDVLIEAFGNEPEVLAGLEGIEFDRQTGRGLLDGRIPVFRVGQAHTKKGAISPTFLSVGRATPGLVEVMKTHKVYSDRTIRRYLKPGIEGRFEGLRRDLLEGFPHYKDFVHHLVVSGTKDALVRGGLTRSFADYLKRHPSEDAAEQKKIEKLQGYIEKLSAPRSEIRSIKKETKKDIVLTRPSSDKILDREIRTAGRERIEFLTPGEGSEVLGKYLSDTGISFAGLEEVYEFVAQKTVGLLPREAVRAALAAIRKHSLEKQKAADGKMAELQLAVRQALGNYGNLLGRKQSGEKPIELVLPVDLSARPEDLALLITLLTSKDDTIHLLLQDETATDAAGQELGERIRKTLAQWNVRPEVLHQIQIHAVPNPKAFSVQTQRIIGSRNSQNKERGVTSRRLAELNQLQNMRGVYEMLIPERLKHPYAMALLAAAYLRDARDAAKLGTILNLEIWMQTKGIHEETLLEGISLAVKALERAERAA